MNTYIPEPVAFMMALLIKGTFEHIAATTCKPNRLGKIKLTLKDLLIMKALKITLYV